MSAPRHEAVLTIPADHPALPGHFPGFPVVPAVVLLERVLELAEGWLARPLKAAALPHAKFLAPLKPGEAAHVELELSEAALRFRIAGPAGLIAQGAFELAECAR